MACNIYDIPSVYAVFCNDTQWLFPIYMGKLRDGRFTVWANVNQNSDLKFCPGILFAICTNQLHLPKKRPRKAETGIKDGLWGNGTRISVWNIPTVPGKQDYLFRSSVAPGSFTPKRPEKSCSIYFLTGTFRKVFVRSKEKR